MESNTSANPSSEPSLNKSIPQVPVLKKKNKTLIILGSIELLFVALVSFFSLPMLFSLLSIQVRLGENILSTVLALLILLITFGIVLAQLIIGLFSLDSKIGEKRKKWLIISGIVLSSILLFLPVFIIQSTYCLVNTV